ncbi:oxidoreductase [Alkaliphilus peptidifermentans]|uniref:2,4-dienoyl-CoA reductase n=1 Tax=Alkaliphilus peptidifermentans DSM 18978 TaxID=1120976 RepID=A0A1G5L1S9_9FIRM|nr:FAD-dependent oxidoreductase [Alkaliphilus peptidifermentans]SCZ06250.1 2,4-dienoyl-CoA reductase [Alkaliphilus peptidifermentans DSM 18978]
MKYKYLFSKGKIGKLELKNRIVMPAIGTGLAGVAGEASDDIIRYYEERAKGGCGLIITEITRIDDEYGVGCAPQLTLTKPYHIPKLQKLIRTIHKYDSKIFVQLHHPGREGHASLIEGRQIVAPSAIMCKVVQEMPRELTTSEIEGLVKKFVTGAKMAQMAGADGVELHAAHGYLINQFISPYTNKRNDKYGGHFVNRMRFITEMILGIKHICGADFPISVRIDGDEFLEGGLKIEDAIKVARYLESIGIDAINVSAGTYETSLTIIEPISFPQGWKRHLAQAIKNAVKIPVIAVNVVRKPEFAESLIKEGTVDFVGVGRGQLADPEWGIKAMEGRDQEIRPCISCLHCIEELGKGGCVKCGVNPRMGRELEFDGFKEDGKGRIVAVIGAGPAGMEAARILALRGFKPVVFEKENQVGGQLQLANKPPLKEKINWLIESMAFQLESLNVEIRLNTEANIEVIKELDAYAVFVATGASPIIPLIEGVKGKSVCTAVEILNGKIKPAGENVAVIGSGMTGLETAELLAASGNNVSVVEMQSEIGGGIYKVNLYDVMQRLGKYGVEMLPSHKLVSISDYQITLFNTITNQSILKPIDRVVLSLGVKSNKEMIVSLEEKFDIVRIIGDSGKPGRIAEAIREGFEKAYVL